MLLLLYTAAFVAAVKNASADHRLYRTVSVSALFAAFIVHTLFLGYDLFVQSQLFPAQIYFYVTSWALALVCLHWVFLRPKIPFSVILMPLVMANCIAPLLFGGGTGLNSDISRPVFFLVMLHTVMFFLSTVTVFIGGVAGICYLLQDRALAEQKNRQDIPPRSTFRPLVLPALEWSLAVCKESLQSALVFLAVGAATGIFLSVQMRTAISAADPLFIGTAALLLCSTAATVCIFSKRHTSGHYFAVVSTAAFGILLLALGFGLLGYSHW